MCLRHDHDACVWMINDMGDDTQWGIKHIHNFSRFGYVEASKTNKKFCVSPTGKTLKLKSLNIFIFKNINIHIFVPL